MLEHCFEKSCSECNKKLGLFGGYRHPIEGYRKCVCGECWNKLEKRERKYSKFIANAVNRKNFKCMCFVLISAKPKYEIKVCNSLVKLPEIIEIHQLLGMYNIIAKIGVKDSEKLSKFVLNKIRTIEGIADTRTLTGTFSLTGIN